jgi:hypothetical protein
MKIEKGFLHCDCGAKAIHNSAIGWKCPEHGVSYSVENTWEKFQKELQEPTLCGACGQYYEENEQGEDAYHAPTLCDANDEIKEYEGGCMDCTFVTDNRKELINHSCNEKGD